MINHYDQGMDAFVDGEPEDSNPYDIIKQAEAHSDWAREWRDAEQDAGEGEEEDDD